MRERIKKARERAGLSQRKLARKIRVTHGAVSLWEAGKRQPSAVSVLKLERALGLRLGALLRHAKTSGGSK